MNQTEFVNHSKSWISLRRHSACSEIGKWLCVLGASVVPGQSHRFAVISTHKPIKKRHSGIDIRHFLFSCAKHDCLLRCAPTRGPRDERTLL